MVYYIHKIISREDRKLIYRKIYLRGNLKKLILGRLSPHTGSVISTANSYNNNYATLTTMQTLPPISTVTSSSQEKYIIIQTNGVASTSMEPISPSRLNQHPLNHSDSALSDCSLNANSSQSEISQYAADGNAPGNYYHGSVSQEPSPPSTGSATSSSGSSVYGNMIQTYNVNIKYEYDVKNEEEQSCLDQSQIGPNASGHSPNNNQNGIRNSNSSKNTRQVSSAFIY